MWGGGERGGGGRNKIGVHAYFFGVPEVPEYRTTLEHFIVDPPISVHSKKYLQLQPWVSAVSRKNRTSLSQIQLILESLEVEKPGFFHVRSLHCCHAPLKIKNIKAFIS